MLILLSDDTQLGSEVGQNTIYVMLVMEMLLKYWSQILSNINFKLQKFLFIPFRIIVEYPLSVMKWNKNV